MEPYSIVCDIKNDLYLIRFREINSKYKHHLQMIHTINLALPRITLNLDYIGVSFLPLFSYDDSLFFLFAFALCCAIIYRHFFYHWNRCWCCLYSIDGQKAISTQRHTNALFFFFLFFTRQSLNFYYKYFSTTTLPP